MGQQRQWSGLIALMLLAWGMPVAAREPLRLNALEYPPSKTEPEILSRAKSQHQPQTEASNNLKQANTSQQILLQVEGNLADGDATLSDGSLYDVHTFQGQAGQTVRITLNSRDFDTYLLLDAPSGEQIAENDDGGSGTNAEIVVQLPEDGLYPVLANAYDQTGRGNYRLAVSVVSEAALQRESQEAEANRLLQQGTAQHRVSQYREALASWQAALALYRQLGSRQGEAYSLGSLGIAYGSLGDYHRAIDYHEQSLAIALEIGDRQWEAKSLGNLGNAYAGLGDYRRAIDYHEQSLAIAREIGDRQWEAGSLGNLGNAHDALGDYRRAIDFHEQSLAIDREIGDRWGEAASLGNLGVAYDSLGDYRRAIDLYEQYLAIARELGDRQGEANSLGNLGLVYASLGDYRRAIDFHEQSLAIKRDIGDLRGEANSLGNLGNAYDALGDYHRAISLYEQYLAIAREIGDRQGEANSLGSLGIAYRRLGDYRRAIDFHEQSLAIAREIGDRQGEANSLGHLGIAHISLGDHRRAIDFHEQYLAIAREIGDRRGEALAMNNLGIAYRNLGDYRRAVDFQEQSLAIAREIGDRRGVANSLGSLGNAYHRLGDYRRAVDFQEQSLAIAREIGDRQDEANSLGNLGSIYRLLGDYRRAIDFHEQSLAIDREIGDRQGEANSLNNIGVALNATNQFAEAEDFLTQSINAYEALRADLTDAEHITIADTQAQAYENLEYALIAQNKVTEALEITERGRAQAFALQLALRQGIVEDESPVIYPDIATIQRIARDQNITLVSYSFVFDEALYIWVIQPTGTVNFQQVNLSEQPVDLANVINDFRATLGASDRGGGFELVAQAAQDEQLRQLHQLLIDPIAQWLPTDPNQQVVIVPQGELFLVPFAALQSADGTYLIEKHTLTTAPSIQVLDLATSLAAQNTQPLFEDALVVGNPTMPDIPDIPLASLPGAEFEAREIGELVGTPALIGNQATETRIKVQLPNAQLIHLATHGLLSYGGSPFDIPGAVALTPGNGEDGLLTADEILDMELQAQLAILSACDTGQGEITGDGVVGLSRSLITAGVPSVVVSLWAVPDAPTASLMTEFYAQLIQGQTKAQALRQAMLATMENHPDPIDWAAFTLIGEAE